MLIQGFEALVFEDETVGIRFKTDLGVFDASVDSLKEAGFEKINVTSSKTYLKQVNDLLVSYNELNKRLRVTDISNNKESLHRLASKIKADNCYNHIFTFDKSRKYLYNVKTI